MHVLSGICDHHPRQKDNFNHKKENFIITIATHDNRQRQVLQFYNVGTFRILISTFSGLKKGCKEPCFLKFVYRATFRLSCKSILGFLLKYSVQGKFWHLNKMLEMVVF